MADRIIDVYMVANGLYHDIDYARQELLKLLAEHENVRVKVAANYSDVEGIAASDFLITYCCHLIPSEEEQVALRDYVSSGKRWIALHGTNAILDFVDEGVACPERAPIFMETLGSQFMAHPPIAPFTVKISDPEHELVAGINEFDTDDELYICKMHGEHHALLHTNFTGSCDGFVNKDWPDDEPRVMYYLHPVGEGEVIYNCLGHCRGHYDMRPVTDYYPVIEKGSWDKPEYYELLRRSIKYCLDRVA